MTQPAVTFQIRQLEERFNTRLFDRAHGHISLTPAGLMTPRLRGAHPRALRRARHAIEGADRASGGLAPDRRKHDDRRFPAAPGAGRVQGALSGGDAAALRRQLRSGAGPDRGAHARPRLHRGRLAPSDARHRRLLRRRAPGRVRAVAPAREAGCRDPRLADGARVHQPGARIGNARGHRSLPAEERRRARHAAGRDGGGQPRGDQGSRRDRTRLRHHVEGDVRDGDAPGAARAGSARRRRSTANFSVVYPKERIHSRLVNAFVDFAKERMSAMQRAG